MHKAIIWMIALCVGLALSDARAADASIMDPSAQQVSVTGNAKENIWHVTRDGKDVPLRSALRMIVPSDYSINLPNAGAWASTPVSWQAGKTLEKTLREALAGHPSLVAQIDTDFRLVTVSSQAPFGSSDDGTVIASVNSTKDHGGEPSPAFVPPLRASGGPMVVSRVTPNVAASGGAGVEMGNGLIAGAPQLTSPAFAAASSAKPTSLRSSAGGIAGPLPKDARMTAAGTTPTVESAMLPASVPPATANTRLQPVPGPLPASISAALQASWEIKVSDHSLRTTLTRWANEAGWQLIWNAPVDFNIDAAATVTGTFDDALREVIASLARSSTPIQAIVYQGNKVIRIIEKGAP